MAETRERYARLAATWSPIIDGIAFAALVLSVALDDRWDQRCDSWQAHTIGALIPGAEWLLLFALVLAVGPLIGRTRRWPLAVLGIVLIFPVLFVAFAVGYVACY
jgi:hypothetical protein